MTRIGRLIQWNMLPQDDLENDFRVVSDEK